VDYTVVRDSDLTSVPLSVWYSYDVRCIANVEVRTTMSNFLPIEDLPLFLIFFCMCFNYKIPRRNKQMIERWRVARRTRWERAGSRLDTLWFRWLASAAGALPTRRNMASTRLGYNWGAAGNFRGASRVCWGLQGASEGLSVAGVSGIHLQEGKKVSCQDKNHNSTFPSRNIRP